MRTPGPWTAKHRSNRESIVRAGDVTVATLLDEHGLDSEAEEARIADARLISAAPDLLDVAKEIDLLSADMEHSDECSFVLDNIVVAHDEGRSVNDCDCWLSRLRAAIAKAEGR